MTVAWFVVGLVFGFGLAFLSRRRWPFEISKRPALRRVVVTSNDRVLANIGARELLAVTELYHGADVHGEGVGIIDLSPPGVGHGR